MNIYCPEAQKSLLPKISEFEEFFIYRIDVNGSVSEVKNVNKSSSIMWEEDRKFCTYMISDTPLDISPSFGIDIGTGAKYIVIAVASLAAIGAATTVTVILKKRRFCGKKG